MPDIDIDHDRPRGRQTVIAVLIAVVFLAVLGASVGFILGSKQGEPGNNVAAEPTGDPTEGGGETPAPTVGPGDNGGNGNGGNDGNGGTRTKTPTNTRSYRPASRDTCPQQTAEALGASGSEALNLVLYVRTARSEAWICQYQGRSVYQGHMRGRGFPAATSDSSILVQNVRYEAGVHAATNGSTVYYVSVERLRIEKDGKETANEPVEDHYGG